MKVSEQLRSILKANPEIEKSDMMDLLHWTKQILALIFGLTVGFFKVQGFMVIIGYLIFMCATSLMYTWQVVQTEEFEGFDIVKEAFMVSFFMFMLSWTMTFTFLQLRIIKWSV